MATTTHEILAVKSGTTYRDEDYEVEYRITFTFWPSERATLTCPGAEPGIEFVSARWADGPGPLEAEELDWCTDWLEEHYDDAVAVATNDRQADKDDHADFLRRQRRDDALTGGL